MVSSDLQESREGGERLDGGELRNGVGGEGLGWGLLGLYWKRVLLRDVLHYASSLFASVRRNSL